MKPIITSYHDQLAKAAKRAGLELRSVMLSAGIDGATIWRWTSKPETMRYANAKAIEAKLQEIAAGAAPADQS